MKTKLSSLKNVVKTSLQILRQVISSCKCIIKGLEKLQFLNFHDYTINILTTDEVMVKSCSDFSRFSSDVDSTPDNVEVAMIGVDDGDGSIGINLVLSIPSGLKGLTPVFLNLFFIVARLIDFSKDYLKIAVKLVLLIFW